MAGPWETSTPLTDEAAEPAIQDALGAVASPGSFFAADRRVAFARAARAARGLEAPADSGLAPIETEAVTRVATKAMTSRSEHVEAWTADGRDVLAYVELVSVVAQVTSIDAYRIGTGAPLDPLPDPSPGEPAPVVDERAVVTNAWVPTVGPALAPTSLSALPKEKATKAGLGAAWYITDDVIHQYGTEPGREISRPQMELVAARTSWLNECFF